MTTEAVPQKLETPAGGDPVLVRLEAFRPLVRATARRWAGSTNRSGVDEEDLAQEITLALWLRLRDQPDMTPGQLAFKAKDAARETLRRGPSVERNVVRQGQHRWRMESLEVLMDDEEGWPDFEADLIARRHGDPADGNRAFSPVEDLALARVLCQQLRESLTPKQRAVLDLRLQGYSMGGIATLWGISAARVHAFMTRIRKKARDLWEEVPSGAPGGVLSDLSDSPRGVDRRSRPSVPSEIPLAGREGVRPKESGVLRTVSERLSKGGAGEGPAPESPFATTDDLARELGLSRIRASNLCKEGKIVGARRAAKRWLIPRPIQVVRYHRWKKGGDRNVA